MRDFIYSWMKNGAAEPVEELFWCIHKDTFAAQMEWFTGKCLQTGKQLEGLYERGLTVGENELWKDSVLLQVKSTGIVYRELPYLQKHLQHMNGRNIRRPSSCWVMLQKHLKRRTAP